MPKSSSASPTPDRAQLRRGWRRAVLGAPCSTASLSSSRSRRAGRPLERRQSATSAGRSGWASWRRERLTPIDRAVLARRPNAAALSWQACISVHAPISTISADSSATGMKSAGADITPPGRVPAQQRLVADDRAGRPAARSAGRRAAAARATAPAPAPPRSAGARARAGAGACRRPPRARGPRPWRGRRRRRRRPAARRGRAARRRRARSRSTPTAGARSRRRPAARGSPRSGDGRARSPCCSSMSSQTITNSSPPSRATVSAGRTVATSRRRERDQQRVARGVAVEVVDALEVVEVDEQHAAPSPRRGPCAPARGSAARGTARGWPARSAGRAAPRGASAPRRAAVPSRSRARWRSPRRKFSSSSPSSPSSTTQISPKTSSPVRISNARRVAARRRPRRPARSPSRSIADALERRASRASARPPPTRGRRRRRPTAPARPSAATAADLRATGAAARVSASRCAVMSRPIASSSGPASVSTIPQLISPTNSLPSRRRPSARIVKRSGWSVAKYSSMLRV